MNNENKDFIEIKNIVINMLVLFTIILMIVSNTIGASPLSYDGCMTVVLGLMVWKMR